MGHVERRALMALNAQPSSVSGSGDDDAATNIVSNISLQSANQRLGHVERHEHADVGARPSLVGSEFRPPYFDWLPYTLAPADCWRKRLTIDGLRISSVFSGICTEHKVASMLLLYLSYGAASFYKLAHTAAF